MDNYTPEQMKFMSDWCIGIGPGCLIGADGRYQLLKTWDALLANDLVQQMMTEAEEAVSRDEFADEESRLKALASAAEEWKDEQVLLVYSDCPDFDIYGLDPRILENEEDGAWLEEIWDFSGDGQVDVIEGDEGTYIAPYVRLIQLVDYVPADGKPTVHPDAVDAIERCRQERDRRREQQRLRKEEERRKQAEERSRHMDEVDARQREYSDSDIDSLCRLASADIEFL